MKKLYIIVAFSIVTSINCMERLTPEELDYDTLAKTAEFLIAMTDITDLAMLVNKENPCDESNAQATASTTEKSFPCPHPGCTRTSRWKNAIDRHAISCPYNQHPDQEARTRFKCAHCGTGFAQSGNRNKHAITCEHNPNKETIPEFKCPHPGCTYTSMRKHDIKVHATTCPHNKTPDTEALTRFKCPHCDKGFAQSSHRNQHLITCKQNQNKEALPEFECPHSGCTYTSKWEKAIDRHAISCPYNQHPDQEALTKFKCPHCGTGFAQSSNRSRHEKKCAQRSTQERETSPAKRHQPANTSTPAAACSSHES